jgi:hypothetical protein
MIVMNFSTIIIGPYFHKSRGGANFSKQAYVFTNSRWGDTNMDFSTFILDIPNYKDEKDDIIMCKA